MGGGGWVGDGAGGHWWRWVGVLGGSEVWGLEGVGGWEGWGSEVGMWR